MKNVRLIVLFFAAVMLMTSCIYDQVMSQMQSDNASGTNAANNGGNNNGGGINNGGSVNSNQITSLQAVIDDANVKDGDVIDLSDSKYININDYSATINKAVTIKNSGFGNDTITIATDGVVLSNIHRANVSTSNSLKISGSSLSSLSIAANSSTQSSNQIVGRGDETSATLSSSGSSKPPVVEVNNCEVAENVSVEIPNAYLTVKKLTAKKAIDLNAANVQLTINDKDTKIEEIKTNKVCQVVLEDGTSDSIPTPTVTGEGELKQIDMKAAGDMKLLKLTPTSGLTPYIQQGGSIDFSTIVLLGTYQADNGITLFKAGGLSENLTETFSKLEKDFIVSIEADGTYKEAYKDGKNVSTFDWATLSATEHRAKITSNWANKAENYAYQFNILVIGASSSAEQGGQSGSENQTEFVMPTFELDDASVDIGTAKIIYNEGDPLNLTGLTVVGTYRAGTISYKNLVPYTLTPPNGTILTADINQVVVSVDGCEDTIIPLVVNPMVKVTFIKDDVEHPYAVRRIMKDTTIDQMNDPVKTGYTFNGWYNGNTRFIVGTTIVTEDITLTADWTPKTITYSFDANGGKWNDNATSRDVTGNYEATVVKPVNPTKIGSTFDGWNPAVPETFGETNISFTAKWTTHGSHKIEYKNTKGVTNPNVTSFIETEDVTLSNLSKIGYSFDGWYDSSSDYSETHHITGWSAGDKTDNVTLYAKWTTNYYIIRFNANNGSGSMSDLTMDYDASSDLPTCTFTAPTGLKFGSWNTSADGTGTNYADGESVINLTATDGAIVTFYAQWIDRNAHTINYQNTKGAANSSNPNLFLESATITLSDISADGYTFNGWYDASADGNQVTGWAAGTKTDNVTLWARWIANSYRVNLTIDDDATYATLDVSFDADMPTVEPPTKTGYTFGGYFFDTNGNGTQYIDADGHSCHKWDQTSDNYIFAKWTPITYTITFDNTADSSYVGSYTPTTSYTIESADFDLPTAVNITRTGYTFGGWYESDSFDGDAVEGIDQGSYGDMVFYAKWTPNTYTVSLKGNTMITVSYDATIDQISPIPTKTGYTFGGYYLDNTNDPNMKYIDENGIGIKLWDQINDKPLHPKWTPKIYTVILNRQGGSGGTETVDVTYNALIPTIDIPTKTGYTFIGYAVKGAVGENYIDANGNGCKVWDMTTDNTALWARWTEKTYTVTLDPNGGTGGITSASVRYGDAFNSIATSNLPTRDGYRFRGYWTEISGGTQYIEWHGYGITDWDIDPDDPDDPITLYAHWDPITYTVVFNANGGTAGAMANLSMTYDVSTDLPMNLFTKYGCLFVGWATLAGEVVYANGQNVKNLSETNGAEVTLYARWQERSSVSVGQIMYSDMTFSSGYVYGKTPIGVVFAVTTDKLKIVHLSEETSLAWCLESANGYSCNPATSTEDGSGNWQIICDTVSDEDTAGNYPAFEYVNDLGDGWYLPAKDEINAIYEKKNAINSAVTELIDRVDLATTLGTGWYFSSSSANYDAAYARNFSGSSSQNTIAKKYVNSVRAVRAF